MEIKGFNFLIISIFLIASILSNIFGKSGAIKESMIGLVILTISFCIPFLFIENKTIKKYLFFGEERTFQEILQVFNSYSYFTCVVLTASILSLSLSGLYIVLEIILGLKIITDFLYTNKSIIFYIFLSISSVIWFGYHINRNKIDTQEIKIKIALYSAIVATILSFVDVFTPLDDSKIILTLIAVSYLWVTYFTELKTKEENQKLRAKQNCNP